MHLCQLFDPAQEEMMDTRTEPQDQNVLVLEAGLIA